MLPVEAMVEEEPIVVTVTEWDMFTQHSLTHALRLHRDFTRSGLIRIPEKLTRNTNRISCWMIDERKLGRNGSVFFNVLVLGYPHCCSRSNPISIGTDLKKRQSPTDPTRTMVVTTTMMSNRIYAINRVHPHMGGRQETVPGWPLSDAI